MYKITDFLDGSFHDHHMSFKQLPKDVLEDLDDEIITQMHLEITGNISNVETEIN